MKPDTQSWKLPVLIGSLAIVALLINYGFFAKQTAKREARVQEEQEKVAVAESKERADRLAKEKEAAKIEAEKAAAKAEADRKQTVRKAKADEKARLEKQAEKAAEEHARFLARYLNPEFVRKPGVSAIAVAVVSERGTANYEIASALTRRFQTDGMQLFTSFFKPDFIADEFVTKAFGGDTRIFSELELTNRLDGVLFGRQSVEYSTNSAALENTITASLRLELMSLPVAVTSQSQSWNFSTLGVGFRAHEARKLAEERIIEQINRNTNMALPQYSLSR